MKIHPWFKSGHNVVFRTAAAATLSTLVYNGLFAPPKEVLTPAAKFEKSAQRCVRWTKGTLVILSDGNLRLSWATSAKVIMTFDEKGKTYSAVLAADEEQSINNFDVARHLEACFQRARKRAGVSEPPFMKASIR